MIELVGLNKKFFSTFKSAIEIDGSSRILVEEPVIYYMTHKLAIFSKILNIAKGYSPVWIDQQPVDIPLIKSIMKGSVFIKHERLLLSTLFNIFLISAIKYFTVKIGKGLLCLSYDGIRYGDIIYDVYLSENMCSTIRRKDYKLFSIIFRCIKRHTLIKRIIKRTDSKAVLVSHQVGLNSGVMLRVALKEGLLGYLCAGSGRVSLQEYRTLDDVWHHPYKPYSEDIERLSTHLGSRLNSEFDEVLNSRYKSQLGDAKYAFSKNNALYVSRKDFALSFDLDESKKNIFVMMHAFTDHPHSAHRGMLFDDYFDWLNQTLKFAKSSSGNVNWIFKQHPSIKHYPVRDVHFKKLFHLCPSNIVFIDESKQIDTRVLNYCADVVITCVGSAGFELPAISGIPAVIAGDSLYSGFGICLEPKTQSDYFSLLGKLEKLEKLDEEQIAIARLVYLYLHKYCAVNMSVCPGLTLEEQNSSKIPESYVNGLSYAYGDGFEYSARELINCIKSVSHENFIRLNEMSLQKNAKLL